jgi:hypothetical protein
LAAIALHPPDSKGMARLVVTMQQTRVPAQYNIKMLDHHLECTFMRLRAVGVPFVATYDLRSCIPAPQIAQALGKLHRKYADLFSQQLNAIGLLVAENLFTLASRGRVGSFITESCLPACPKAILHSERIVERFFQTTAESSSTPSFVSVAGVRKNPDNTPGMLETSLATLVPFKAHGSPPSSPQRVGHVLPLAPMMHTLENGDVRVIQSAATDVMLRPTEHGINHGNPQDGSEVAEESTQQTKQNNEKTSERVEISPGELQLVEALKFRGPAAKLKQFVGMHFHIGELTIDADAASSILRGPAKTCGATKVRKPRRSDKIEQANIRSDSFATGLLAGCWAGIALLCGS